MTDGTLKMYTPPYLNHPRKAINVPEPVPNILTRTQRAKISVAKIVTAQENHKYLGKHPEAKAIIRLILRQIFKDRPANIPDFVAKFVQREEFPFEVSDLVAETKEGSQTSRNSDGGSSEGDSFERLFNKMFAGLESLMHHGSMADVRTSFATARSRSRSRSVLFAEHLGRRSQSDLPEDKKSSVKLGKRHSSVHEHSHERKRSSQDRRHSRRKSSHKVSSHLTSIEEHERRHEEHERRKHEEHERKLSTFVQGEHERRSTLTHEKRHSVADQQLTTATGEPIAGDEPEMRAESETDVEELSSSSSDSWDSDGSLDLSLGSDWDENELALFEGQTLIFAMLGKRLDTKLRDLDEKSSSSSDSDKSRERLTERAVQAAFRPKRDKTSEEVTSVASSNADMSLYTIDGISRISTLDESTREEDEEYFG